MRWKLRLVVLFSFAETISNFKLNLTIQWIFILKLKPLSRLNFSLYWMNEYPLKTTSATNAITREEKEAVNNRRWYDQWHWNQISFLLILLIVIVNDKSKYTKLTKRFSNFLFEFLAYFGKFRMVLVRIFSVCCRSHSSFSNSNPN